jgi:hypothetical protein
MEQPRSGREMSRRRYNGRTKRSRRGINGESKREEEIMKSGRGGGIGSKATGDKEE